jgi:DnaK suppressor protein
MNMATTKAKTKASKSEPATAKSARPAPRSSAPSRAEAGSYKAVGISPADLPLPTGYVPKVELTAGYRPRADEEYMSAVHLEYFRRKLLIWRQELIEESQQTIENLRDEVRDVGDEAERATRETENSLELRTRDRYRKLIGKIDKALKRIEDGRYGYCEETDEEIGLERLEARPIATMCLDAQERWEHRQRQMGD